MNAYDDDNGASLQPIIEPRFPFGIAMIAAALGWALICGVVGWWFT